MDISVNMRMCLWLFGKCRRCLSQQCASRFSYKQWVVLVVRAGLVVWEVGLESLHDLILLYFFLLQMIPVAANDVAFSIHAVVMTALTLFQIFIYEVSIEVFPLCFNACFVLFLYPVHVFFFFSDEF